MKRCSLNEYAFDIITEDSAYWIGFLMADGNVCYKTDVKGRGEHYIISLTLQAVDLDHLLNFQKFLGSSHRIHYRVNTKMKTFSYSLQFSSEKIAHALAQFGIVPKKSLITKVISLECNVHFWGGVIDGDGTISVDPLGRPWIKLVGSLELVSQFKGFLKRNLDTDMPQVYRTGSIYRIVITCNTCVRVVKLLYDNSTISLSRKLDRAQKIIQPGGIAYLRNEIEDPSRKRLLKF